MRSWSARFRRAAAVLLCLHVAQTTALAAVAPCEGRAPTAVRDADAIAVSATATATATAHDHAAMHQVMASQDPEPTDSPPSHHDPRSHAPATCSMAMACAVTASPTAPVLLPALRDRLDIVRVSQVVRAMPTAAAYPPEPPPPKA